MGIKDLDALAKTIKRKFNIFYHLSVIEIDFHFQCEEALESGIFCFICPASIKWHI